MAKPPVFFWQNMPAHHQVGALDAFAKNWGAPVTGVWMEDISKDRRSDGWQSPRRAHLRDVFLPAGGWQGQVDELASTHLGAIHLFSGIGAYPPVTRAAGIILNQEHPKSGLIIETALKSPWRRLPSALKSIYHYYPVRTKIGAVMAIGSLAEDFYQSIGFEESQIYPYIYQCDAPSCSTVASSSAELQLAFVGRLAGYKGLDILLEALAMLTAQAWSLDVYGDGPAKVEPSRYDGWGMATSEALQAGIPVLVSDAAGSRDLIRASGAGDVFASGMVSSLTALLAHRMGHPKLILEEKRRARAYAPKITPEVVGTYLAEALEHAFLGRSERPSPPWRG
jgi:glycosyltransferase involved in cell wall biosynthesis